MLQPKRTAYRKQQKGRNTGIATNGTKVSFGEFGLKVMECGWINARQIEAGRRAITGNLKRKGKLWIKIFPDKSFTMKPTNSKMIGGKGAIEGYVAVVKPGCLIFELGGVPEADAKEAFRLAGHKLGLSTKFVKRVAI